MEESCHRYWKKDQREINKALTRDQIVMHIGEYLCGFHQILSDPRVAQLVQVISDRREKRTLDTK